MLTKWKTRINEKGSLLIEAMAMLGLIAMVTPILYKKAAERTTEIRDINAASEMRGLIKAVDDYLKDNYEAIINGQTITIQSGLTRAENESVNWTDFKNTDAVPQYHEYQKTVPIEHFAEYLPYGVLDENGVAVGSRTFRGYKVVVKKVDSGVVGGDTINKQILTGFVLGEPTEPNFPMIRASRIASMIGSNGGYAPKDNQISGSQGIWGIENVSTDLGLAGVKEGDVLTASIQSISSGGGDYEGVLYRVPRKERKLNTMSTTLMMGNQSIKDTNQMIISAAGADFDGTKTPSPENQANALILFNEGGSISPGARIQGRIAAAVTGMKRVGPKATEYYDNYSVDTSDIREQFLVDEESNTSIDAKLKSGLIEKGALDPNDPSITARDNDEYNLEVEKDNVKVATERMNVGDALQIFPVAPGSTKDKEEDGSTVGDNTRMKINAESGLIVESIVNSGPYAGTTELDVNSKGMVTSTTGSVNLITGEAFGDQEASLQLGGTDVPGEVGVGVAELFGIDQASIGTARDIETDDDIDFLNRIPEETSQLLMYGGETKLEADFVDVITTNYSDATGSRVSLDYDKDNDWDRIYLHSDNIHLHARNELQIETDEDLRLTADNIYNEVEDQYVVSMIKPRSGTGGDAVVTKDLMYMTGTEANIMNEQVNIGNFEERDANGTVLTNSVPVVSIQGDAASLPQYGDTGQVINIKRGAIEIERNPLTNATPNEDPRSYIKVDRILANEPLDGGLPANLSSNTSYDAYQVNPAYTSVMHDIKLTTRGGARLSDILPDFINKGIYVVDTTYAEDRVGDWDKLVVDGNGQIDRPQVKTHNREDPVSPWAGFVPKPLCPPGYARVITVIPAGLAMAQAGIPIDVKPGEKPSDLAYPTDIPQDPFENYTAENGYGMDPLFFQKNTWFRAKALPHYKGNTETAKNFQGWSVFLGFIYPYTYYEKYIKRHNAHLHFDTSDFNDFTVIWNLFPTYRKELEAYATVYCYFDRLSTDYDGTYVDKYNQLDSYRPDDEKDGGYINRLNDPSLHYDDPW